MNRDGVSQANVPATVRRLRRLVSPVVAEPARRRRRRRILALAGIVAAIVAAVLVNARDRDVPDPVPPRTIEPFVLTDHLGRSHTPDEWRDAKAVVVFVIGTHCPFTGGACPEMRRLAAAYGNQGVTFVGVVADPSETAEGAARYAEAHRLPFPILLDPSHEFVAELGILATPEAAVLDGEGHVLYRGPTLDRPGGNDPPLAEQVIRAVIADRTPPIASAAAFGSLLPAPKPILAKDATVTFHKDVAPILWERCAGCHRPGEVGPFSLLSYRDAAKRAAFLSEEAGARQMPPWRAVHGYGDFEDLGRLSRRELATLARWAETGAPEGDPQDRRDPPTFPEGWRLGTPDNVITMPEPFVVPAGGGDIYRAFVLPLPLEADTAVAAVEFRPGNRRIVHHARFYVDPSSDCRRRDDADATPGFASLGGGDIVKPGLGAWVPGLIPRMPPSDVGKVIRKGSDLVMLIHYHGTGKEETDQSSIGLYYCRTPPTRKVTTLSLSTIKIDIPPGANRHRMTQTTYLKADAHAIAVMPHGHYLMRQISLTATRPDGKVVPMLWIDDWDFDWQGQYHFARPVPVPKGTRLDLVAVYDNSSENSANPNVPPRRVKFGYASTDEMLGCHVQVIADDDEAQRVFDRTLPLGL
jgi:peroxiredoxin